MAWIPPSPYAPDPDDERQYNALAPLLGKLPAAQGSGALPRVDTTVGAVPAQTQPVELPEISADEVPQDAEQAAEVEPAALPEEKATIGDQLPQKAQPSDPSTAEKAEFDSADASAGMSADAADQAKTYDPKLMAGAPGYKQPVETPVAAPQDKPTWYGGFAPKNERELASSDSNQSKLVTKSPDWYNFEAPPDIDGNIPALMQIVAGLIQAGVAKDTKSAVALALSGVADAATTKFINAPQADYHNKLKAAQAQSSMTATLNGRGTAGRGNDLAAERLAFAKAKETAKQAGALEAQDPNSRVSKALRQAAKLAQMLPQNDETTTAEQLQFVKPQMGQAARQDESQGNVVKNYNMRYKGAIEKFQMANNEHDRRVALGEINKIDAEDREQTKVNETANIPGLHLVGKRAPTPQDVATARNIKDASDRATFSANQLIALQDRLSKGRLAGFLYKYFADDQDGKQALADAKIHQKNLMDAQRELSKLGVLQEFEKRMVEETNPSPGSLDEFFMGPFDYNAYARVMPKYAAQRLQVYNYAPDDAAEAHPAPAIQRNALSTAKELHHTMGGATKQAAATAGVVANNAVDTAGQVAGAVAPAAKVSVRLLGKDGKTWSKPAEVTIEKFKQLQEQFKERLEQVQ